MCWAVFFLTEVVAPPVVVYQILPDCCGFHPIWSAGGVVQTIISWLYKVYDPLSLSFISMLANWKLVFSPF